MLLETHRGAVRGAAFGVTIVGANNIHFSLTSSRAARVAFSFVAIILAAVGFGFWLHVFEVGNTDLEVLVRHLRWWTLPVIASLLLTHIILSAIRWSRIEVAFGGSAPPLGQAILTGAWALGLGTFLPGPLANVACRGVSNRMMGSSGIRGALSGGADQVADIAITLLFAIPASLAFLTRSAALYVGGCVVAALLGWLVCQQLPQAALSSNGKLSKKLRLGSVLSKELLGTVYSLTLLRFLNLTALTLMIHFATGMGSFGATLISVPLVTLAISVAMLPGGFGVTEWSFTAIFSGLGMPAADITIFVLANRIILSTFGVCFGVVAVLLTVRRIRLLPT